MWLSERRNLLKLVAFAPVGLLLFGCGFEPMYGDGSAARRITGRVQVELIETERGYVLYQRLIELLGQPDQPTHYLSVDLDLETDGTALTQDNLTTRFKVDGTAAFRLTPLTGNHAVFVDEVKAVAGFSAPESKTASAFASRSAEKDANIRVTRSLAEQIVQRIALNAEDWAQ